PFQVSAVGALTATGVTVKSATSGQRIELLASSNSLGIYSALGLAGSISGSDATYLGNQAYQIFSSNPWIVVPDATDTYRHLYHFADSGSFSISRLTVGQSGSDYAWGLQLQTYGLSTTGQLKISGGSPGAGKVLTDVGGTGLATWETNSAVGGWTDDGGVVRLTTITDQVGIGTTTPDNNSRLDIRNDIGSPTTMHPNMYSVIQGKGDNATFLGVSGGYFRASDRSDVTASNKGVLYGIQVSVYPRVARNNVPYDDVGGVVIQNDGLAMGTDAIYVGRNAGISGDEWGTTFTSDANSHRGICLNGTYIVSMLDLKNLFVVDTLGAVTTGIWQGTPIASAYIGAHGNHPSAWGSPVAYGYIADTEGGVGTILVYRRSLTINSVTIDVITIQ
ncbi:MAG: hypothetical protein V1897_04025, partial [Pseudomonadota bacterium]